MRDPLTKLQFIFGVLFAVVAALVELLIPLGGGLDEVQHAARVDQLSHGEVAPVFVEYSPLYEGTPLAGTDASAEYGGYVDTNLYQLLFEEQTKLHTTAEPFAFPAWRENSIGATRYGEAGRSLQVFSNTVINNPVVYLPSLVGELVARALVGTTASAVVGMRLGGLVAFWLILLVAIRLAPRFMGWIVAFVGLLPSTIATVAFVSADTMTVAAALLFLSCWAALMAGGNGTEGPMRSRTSDARMLTITMASGLLLGLAKLVYMPLTLLMLLLPVVRQEMRTRRGLGISLLVPTGSLALCLVQAWSIRGINTGAMFKAGVDPMAQAQWVLGHPAGFIKMCWMCLAAQPVLQEGELGVFTFVAQRPSGAYAGWTLIGCYALLFVVVLRGIAALGHQGSRRGRMVVFLALVGEFLAVSLLVCGGLYATFSEVGASTIEGVQARYFIPLVPLLVLALALLVAPQDKGRQGRASHRLEPAVALAALLAVEELGFLVQVWACLY